MVLFLIGRGYQFAISCLFFVQALSFFDLYCMCLLLFGLDFILCFEFADLGAKCETEWGSVVWRAICSGIPCIMI